MNNNRGKNNYNNRINLLEKSLNDSNYINHNNFMYQIELNKFILSSINRLNYISDNQIYNNNSYNNQRYNNQRYNNQRYNNQRYNNKRYNNKRYNNKRHNNKRYNNKRYNNKRYNNKRYNNNKNNNYQINNNNNNNINNNKNNITTYDKIKKIFMEKDIINGSMNSIGKGNVPFNMIKCLYTNDKIEEKKKKNISKRIVIDYTSDDEFEEIKMKVNNLKDLINLCKYSIEIIGKNNISNSIVDKSVACSSEQEVKNILNKNKDLYFLDPFNNISVVNKNDINNIIKNEKNNKEENKEIISHYEFNGKKYNINLKILSKLLEPLNKLNNLIGLTNLKNSIVEQIIYYIQNFEINNDNMLHTTIEGPPGVGKTEVGKILAEIFSKMEIIPTNKFKIVKRTDLIGEYLGHTAHKTQKVIDEANGGVLFIDEAYSLGSFDKKDNYAKECIDTLNQNLSENKNKIICIIAGYPDQLDKCFFSYNPGLARRFPFRHKIESYSFSELKNIFINMVDKIGWNYKIKKNDLLNFFKQNYKEFPNFAGDVENLVMNCKYSHSKRILLLHPKNRKKINLDDINNGFKRYCSFKNKSDKDHFISLYN